MSDSFREFLLGALHGKPDYADPVAVLENLTVAQATVHPHENLASIWEQLTHIQFWLDHSLELIRGEQPPYPETAAESWPSPPPDATEKQWSQLVAYFWTGLDAASEIARTADLDGKIAAKNGSSVAEELIVIIQHNAYHFGQIVTLRRMLGLWPPPSGGMTW
jgi:uncharacterized damage-inducible protein DinB